MAADAIKKSFSLTLAKDLADNFDNDASDQYFLLFGKVDSWANAPYLKVDDNTPAANVDTLEMSNYAWRDGIALKRISSRNIYHMIPRNDWTYNTSYDSYDHASTLFGTDTTFFVYTNSGNVYKCIGNNDGGASEYEPDHTQTEILKYQDGYEWKYMYTVTEDSRDFISSSYIPIRLALDNSGLYSNQWNVQQAATVGSIDVIETTAVSGWTAARWDKSKPFQGGSDSFCGGDSNVGATQIKIDLADHIVDVNYYAEYAIYISSGPGVGQKRKITSYDYPNDFILFTTPLTEAVTTQSTYKIFPDLVVEGDGASAEAIPVMNVDASIGSVSVLNPGSNYTIADISVWPKGVCGGRIDDPVDTTDGNLRGPTFSAIMPPPGGHGNNSLNELCAKKIMIRASVKGTDTNFRTGNDFRQISIIKNPLISGGTNDGKVLGTEITRKKQLTVVTPYFGSGFNASAFVVDNSVMGETTKATGKITSFSFDPTENTIGTLELADVEGDFDIDDPASISTRIVWDSTAQGNTGDLTVGNTLKQTNGSLVSIGTINSWSAPTDGPYEVVVDVTANAFVNNTNAFTEYDPDGVVTGVFWENPIIVERKMGELIKHFSSTQGDDFAFIPFGTPSYQNVARANKLTDVQDEETLESSYSITTKLTITSADDGLDSTTYTKDDTVYQVTLDGGFTQGIVTGKIVDWVVDDDTPGSTGAMYLNDVRGTFVAGAGAGFSAGLYSDGDHTISEIISPSVKIGSGEVLYIQNMDPITRSIEQDEEIKILIGF